MNKFKIYDNILSVVSLTFSIATIEEVLSIILLVLTICSLVFRGVMAIIKAGKEGDTQKVIDESQKLTDEVKQIIENGKEKEE